MKRTMKTNATPRHYYPSCKHTATKLPLEVSSPPTSCWDCSRRKAHEDAKYIHTYLKSDRIVELNYRLKTVRENVQTINTAIDKLNTTDKQMCDALYFLTNDGFCFDKEIERKLIAELKVKMEQSSLKHSKLLEARTEWSAKQKDMEDDLAEFEDPEASKRRVAAEMNSVWDQFEAVWGPIA
ncbi:MAG: hypothetical protein Q9227_009139 [Pyrenula ochraceoflavens]